MNKYNVGDRVVVDDYAEDLNGVTGVVTVVPNGDDRIYYDVTLDEPVANMSEWLFSESEIRSE
jgi:hypothetical protein